MNDEYYIEPWDSTSTKPFVPRPIVPAQAPQAPQAPQANIPELRPAPPGMYTGSRRPAYRGPTNPLNSVSYNRPQTPGEQKFTQGLGAVPADMVHLGRAAYNDPMGTAKAVGKGLIDPETYKQMLREMTGQEGAAGLGATSTMIMPGMVTGKLLRPPIRNMRGNDLAYPNMPRITSKDATRLARDPKHDYFIHGTADEFVPRIQKEGFRGQFGSVGDFDGTSVHAQFDSPTGNWVNMTKSGGSWPHNNASSAVVFKVPKGTPIKTEMPMAGQKANPNMPVALPYENVAGYMTKQPNLPVRRPLFPKKQPPVKKIIDDFVHPNPEMLKKAPPTRDVKLAPPPPPFIEL